MNKNYLSKEDSVATMLSHPAFEGFGGLLLPRADDIKAANLPLTSVGRLMPYHSHVDHDTVVNALNGMIDAVAEGQKIFYRFYSPAEMQADPDKNDTGLFFFRSKPGAPFAVICPGGGFAYVGSLHEGFPYAMEINKAGYNAFVLKYRVGGGGRPAMEDLIAALDFILNNAGLLEISTRGYSVWGSSAGARMAAFAGSYAENAGLPKPATVVMVYTGQASFTPNDPPTFTMVSADDWIASPVTVEKRVNAMRKAGIDVEFHKYSNAGHGFGLGTGTDAEGWINHAINFWEKRIEKTK